MLSVEPFADCSFIIDSREKKRALTKAYRFTPEAEKLLLNPEGWSYRRLCKQGNEGRKKKKIVNNKHLSLINLYLPEQRRPECIMLNLIIWQAVVQMYPIL